MLHRIFTPCLFVTLLAFCSTTASLSAQNAKPSREIGLQFNSLDLDGGSGFSAFFKKEIKENTYRRIRFFSGNLSTGVIGEEFDFDVSAGIGIGREKRKQLDTKLDFYQGPEFAFSFRVSSLNETESQILLTPAFGWVLGLQHSFNDRWAVNLETIPNASVSFYSNTNDEDSRFLRFRGGFSNSVSLGLVRKF